jgi:hypothetical protein
VLFSGLSALALIALPAIVSAAADISGVDLDQDASTGLSDFGLTKQFRVLESYFIKGPNRIEVALYTGADVGISSNVNLRLEGSTRIDEVAKVGSPWTVAASPATTENPKIQNRAIVGGSDGPMNSPLVIMSDQFFTMRYRPKTGIGNILATGDQSAVPWSDWTRPALVEGWIKRVLAAINPFNQRITDFLNNSVNTDVSLLTQVGTRWFRLSFPITGKRRRVGTCGPWAASATGVGAKTRALHTCFRFIMKGRMKA